MLLTRLNADICASVPFVIGTTNILGQEAMLPRVAAGMALIWPLYLAATMDTVAASTRAWVITRFERLGHVMGIQQGLSLAHVLRTKKHITAWDRFESTRVDEEIEDW